MYVTATLPIYYIPPFPIYLAYLGVVYVTLRELDFGLDINACSYMALTVW